MAKVKVTNTGKSPLGLPNEKTIRQGASMFIDEKLLAEHKKNPAVAAWFAGGRLVEGETQDQADVKAKEAAAAKAAEAEAAKSAEKAKEAAAAKAAEAEAAKSAEKAKGGNTPPPPPNK